MSLGYRILLASGRWFEPMSLDVEAIVARALGRLCATDELVALELWQNLTKIERDGLHAYTRSIAVKSPEARVAETDPLCSWARGGK
jgi:hypothetical protein